MNDPNVIDPTSPSEPESPEPQGRRRDTHADVRLKDGRYHCTRILGEGSMGRTYLATDAETEQEVAVKALYPSRLAEVKDLELFRREAEVLQKLDHDQIPAYIDAFDEGEGESTCYYLVQEYVEGDTLRSVFQTGKRWSEEESTRLAADLFEVLINMQGMDSPVVHRDIKPENIIVRSRDDKPCLVDFGAVREVVRLTMRGGSTIIGTYGYMPPEQLMGRALPATDLYAVGITLLESLTRQTPRDLHGEDAARMIEQVTVSEDFRRFLSRLCAPDLTERYETAQQAYDDLKGLGKGALVHAKRLERSIAEKKKARAAALKKAGRHGLDFVYIFLVLITLIAAIAALTFLINALATSFQAGFLIALAVSGVGLLGNLALLVKRYTHDSWEPPTGAWRKTKGRVLGSRHHVYDNNSYWTMEYELLVGSSWTSFSAVSSRSSGDATEGREFEAWYKPGQPNIHEMEDFYRDDIYEMRRLFDATVEHTPE